MHPLICSRDLSNAEIAEPLCRMVAPISARAWDPRSDRGYFFYLGERAPRTYPVLRARVG